MHNLSSAQTGACNEQVERARSLPTEFVQFGIETKCFGGTPTYTTFN